MTLNYEPIEILLVEDNPADARLTMEALKDHRILNNVHHVQDGEEGLAFLRREPPHEHAPRPDLVLLDLNLPRLEGHGVLEEMKKDVDLREIPVVILTTSEEAQDELHASSYVTKPVDFEAFMSVIQDLGIYWFTVVRLPSRAES